MDLIAGLGMDLIEIERIAAALERSGERFRDRILSAQEKNQAHGDQTAYLAGRFAAKEAAVKALGIGIRNGIGWHDILVLNGRDGEPRIDFRGKAKEALLARNAEAVHVTITHSNNYAAAVVVLEGTGHAVELSRRGEPR